MPLSSPGHYDALETRSPREREQALLAALPEVLQHARASSPAMAQALDGIDLPEIRSRKALARLPVTRKSELLQRQQQGREARQGIRREAGAFDSRRERAVHRADQYDPMGGFSAIGWGHLGGALRVFASPGPIYEPEGARRDYWRLARALHAAGFRRGDLIHNCFSYHMTPAGSMMETGAHALGCTVFPGGTGQTEQQLQAIADLQPEGYTGTPSFLRILVEKGIELGMPVSFTRALVSGEAFPPSLRDWLREHGIEGYQAYATADLGLIAYESTAREGLVISEDVIVEIVRPGTGDPVPEGEVGELVITTFNLDYPLVRFGTGDLSAFMPGSFDTPSPCGRTAPRIRGWMGRADQTTKVRGMFVHPSQVADVLRRHPELQRGRLVVTGRMAQDELTLKVEAQAGVDVTAMLSRIAETVRDITKLRAEVALVPAGSLPNDGKVIEDARSYE